MTATAITNRNCPICHRPLSSAYQKIGDQPAHYVAWCLGVCESPHDYISAGGGTELEAIAECQKRFTRKEPQ